MTYNIPGDKYTADEHNHIIQHADYFAVLRFRYRNVIIVIPNSDIYDTDQCVKIINKKMKNIRYNQKLDKLIDSL